MAKDEPTRGERWVTRVLRDEAERHEPDRERVRARIWSQEAADGAGTPGARVGWSRVAWVVPVVTAAAGVVVVSAVTVLGARPGSGPATAVPTQPVQILSSAGSPSPGLSAIGPAATAPPGSTPTASTGPTASPSIGGSSTGRGSLQVEVLPVAAGRVVTLPGAGGKDWLVAGARQDGAVVRDKSGGQRVGGPHLGGNPSWAVTDGPFVVSWSGGMPEQNRSGDRTWLSVHGPAGGPVSGMRVSAPAGPGKGTLVLYAGATGAAGHLRAALGGGAAVEAHLPAGPGASGYVVSIRFAVTGAPDSLDVDLTSGSNGSVCLAAAVLR